MMNPPFIFNIFKPVGMTSFDVIRHFKKHLPPFQGKIGHFGTLDPFACGVLLIGISGASRLTQYIHDFFPKTYLAIGKLGVKTDTGDSLGKVLIREDLGEVKKKLLSWDQERLEYFFQEHFLGNYFQAPPAYSAAKFQGRPLYEWARDHGTIIQKEAKLRNIFRIQIVKFRPPYLCVRVEVSGGTYIRTLFEDMAKLLGCEGTLVSLVRESIGPIGIQGSLKKKDWPRKNQSLLSLKEEEAWSFDCKGLSPKDVLPFPSVIFPEDQAKCYKDGKQVFFDPPSIIPDSFRENLWKDLPKDYVWICNQFHRIIGLAQYERGFYTPLMTFPHFF